jgi:predicted metal-dependent phosphoesterase TrpH
MRIDCHTHPLAHRYYYDRQHPDILTQKDQEDIAAVLNMAVDRGLDAVAVTDHDLALSGLWAKEYAKQELPFLRVIAGCECELYFQNEWIHVLALNIHRPLAYTPYTSPNDLAAQVRSQGGIAVLAHPMCYSEAIYHSLKDIVDGVEWRNGAQEFAGRASYKTILDQDCYPGLRLYNSDYHYPSQPARSQWNAATELSREDFSYWFGQNNE